MLQFCRKLGNKTNITQSSYLNIVYSRLLYKLYMQTTTSPSFLTQTCKQEYASARHIEPCRGFKKEKYCTVCALSIYSRLCIKMSSFLFVRTWAMPRILYPSCGIPFPVWTPNNISGLTSVAVWLSR